MEIAIIVAMDENRFIGSDGQLPWPPGTQKGDMARFMRLTMGHPVIMGRKTYESISPRFRPLEGRTNIVVSRDVSKTYEGCMVVHSFDEAIATASTQPGSEEVFVAGGAEIYALALPKAEIIYHTMIQAESGGNISFPPYNQAEWKMTQPGEMHPSDDNNRHPYTFRVLRRKAR